MVLNGLMARCALRPFLFLVLLSEGDSRMKFQEGDTVFHRSKEKFGIVSGLVGGEESRYYVDHSGFRWSVPEVYLASEEAGQNALALKKYRFGLKKSQ